MKAHVEQRGTEAWLTGAKAKANAGTRLKFSSQGCLPNEPKHRKRWPLFHADTLNATENGAGQALEREKPGGGCSLLSLGIAAQVLLCVGAQPFRFTRRSISSIPPQSVWFFQESALLLSLAPSQVLLAKLSNVSL